MFLYDILISNIDENYIIPVVVLRYTAVLWMLHSLVTVVDLCLRRDEDEDSALLALLLRQYA